MKRLLLILTILFGVQTAAMAQSFPIPSLWTNGIGTTLQVTRVDPTYRQGLTIPGTVTVWFVGTYIHRARGFPCRGKPYPVSGWVERRGSFDTSVMFRVTFTGCYNGQGTWWGTIGGRGMSTRFSLVYYAPNGTPLIVTGEDGLMR
jgi:hypothetical protein